MHLITLYGKVITTLIVNNDAGSNKKEITDYPYITGSTPTLNDTYFGDFNDETEANENWAFYNKYQEEKAWRWKADNGYGISSGFLL
ncbi:MAG: hypothetical protein H7Y00_04335 [Fimbriimonadaceae bacterium]|nr:hypothetical protein [Chitinophagales bacterium]